MGKKITLDFSKVEERSGWNTKEIPEGLYEFKIELVDLKDANDGTEMWTYGLRPTDPRYKTRLFPYYCKHQQNQYFKLRDIFLAAGIPVPKKKVSLDPDSPVGKLVAAEVNGATGQYAGRSELGSVYDRKVISDDDLSVGDTEDDEVDAEDEEYDEPDGANEEEIREEIEALSLAELRKRAKSLEIDTDGVRKADLIELVIEAELEGGVEDEEEDEEDYDLDDDDLDDEELEDDDFEDEEDEPEPAPRRRRAASAKPAAKPAATPARRVVKRR